MELDRIDELADAVVLTQELLATGLTSRGISAAVRRGEWHRIRRGAYVAAPMWSQADPEERHVLRMHAVRRSYGDAVAFSHVSAAIGLGISVWGADLSRVHVTRLDGGAGRAEPDIVHHEGLVLAADDTVECHGLRHVAPARAALEVGLLTGPEGALVSLDSALHTGLASTGDLQDAFDLIQHWPRARRLQIPVRMADGAAQSPGESRSRWLFFTQHVPAPLLQYEVRSTSGRLIGFADFGWPEHRALGEFDGRAKYGRLLRPGQSPEDAVFAEKVREDAMRRTTGFGMIRLVWADLSRPRVTGQMIREYLAAAA